MKFKFLVLMMTVLISTAAFANAHDVVCNTFSQSEPTMPLITISVDTRTGKVSLGETTYHLQCQNAGDSSVPDSISCVGVETPHQVKVSVFSVDGILNIGTLSVDGIEFGDQSSAEKYVFCHYSFN